MEREEYGIPILPTIRGEGITDTFYKALREVHEKGFEMRTQYDRKNSDGSYFDPPGRDARVMIEIKNLFAEPRFPKVGDSEWGKYIAEFLGAKDHLIVPTKELLRMIKEHNQEFSPTKWPYGYHQRLTLYPLSNGSTLNQLEKVTDRLAKDSLTRRAVAMTGFPEIDLFISADMPCLRELQFRAINQEDELVLQTFARWRSRAMYTAWSDNLVGLRNLLQFEVVPMLEAKSGKKVRLGSYSEENGSLHIYGQEYKEKGMNTFFQNNPTLLQFLQDSHEKQDIFDGLIIDQLKELRGEEQWRFPQSSIQLIDMLIESYESKRFVP